MVMEVNLPFTASLENGFPKQAPHKFLIKLCKLSIFGKLKLVSIGKFIHTWSANAAQL